MEGANAQHSATTTKKSRIDHQSAAKPALAYAKSTRPTQISRLPGSRNGSLDADSRKAALGKLHSWRIEAWADDDQPRYSPTFIIMDEELKKLTERMHVASTRERFDLIAAGWISYPNMSQTHLNSLWEAVVEILAVETAATMERKRAKKGKGKERKRFSLRVIYQHVG
ncbi:uncharacterized protein EI90DRAFT_3024443 [Cantharellus anzutake]|uniref:uncharacterized protein n=1 Tax=Cantharellus anzutake TaxID=1750568 RepID=UPI001905F19D|nr:uncharacterized protein EI90DRAFT_3024443 [Cantharellus anzutake]KAF8310442.1 hypothetical protein EI90DRAFT_3024443 [Cantharellus anzutake]